MTNYTKEHTKKSSNRTIDAQHCCLHTLNVCNCFHNRRVALLIHFIRWESERMRKKNIKTKQLFKIPAMFRSLCFDDGQRFFYLSDIGQLTFAIFFGHSCRSIELCRKGKSFQLVSILFIRLLFIHSFSFFSLTNSTHVIALHQIMIFVFNWIELQDERLFRGRIVFSFQNPIFSFVAILCPCLYCAKYNVATPSSHDVCACFGHKCHFTHNHTEQQ